MGEKTRAQKAADTKSRRKAGLDIRRLWRQANTGERAKWAFREQKSLEFFLNAQLSKDEADALAAAGMPSFVINRVTPIIETMKYFVTAKNPSWKAVGVDGSDSKMATMLTDIISYSWYISDGRAMFGSVIQDALTRSKGYVHIYVDPDSDKGQGDVKLERVDPFHVYTASMSTDFMERDADYQIIKKRIPKEVLKNKFPEFIDIINKANSEDLIDDYGISSRDIDDENTPIFQEDVYRQAKLDGTDDEIMDYYEVYHPIRVKYYNVYIQRKPSDREIAQSRMYIDSTVKDRARELDVAIKEKDLELRQAMANGSIIRERYELEIDKMKQAAEDELKQLKNSLSSAVYDEATVIEQVEISEEEFEAFEKEIKASASIVKAIPFWKRMVEHKASVGDMLLYSDVMNIEYSPLVAIPYTHIGTPLPMSAVTPLVGKQQEINKAHQIMIHNANLASNLRWKYVEGEIDEEEWEMYSSSPGALLKYRPGFSNSGPTEIMPQSINNAFFTIEQDAKTDMEYIAGIQPPSMGISSGSEETYRGFLAKDEYGTRRIKAWVQNVVEPALEHIGKIHLQMAKDLYKAHKVFRIVQPVSGGGYKSKEFETNIPIYDDYGEEIGKFNNIQNADYDIRIVAGSTLPVNRWAVLDEYKQWLQLGIIDDIEFIKHTDIEDKEAIIQRKSMMAQLESRVNSLEETIKDKEGTIETLERQLVQAGIKNKIMAAEKEIDRDKTESKMVEKLAQQRMRDDLKSVRDASKK